MKLAAPLVMALALLTGGCASLSPPPPQRQTQPDAPLSGRMSVKVEGSAPRSLTAVFDLQGTAQSGTLGLSTPLGSMLAQARWSPGQVTLSTPRGSTSYADLESMTQEVLGERVPVAALFDWLHARPWPGAGSRALDAPANGFEQLGWTVDLARFDHGFVDARRGATPPVSVLIRLD